MPKKCLITFLSPFLATKGSITLDLKGLTSAAAAVVVVVVVVVAAAAVLVVAAVVAVVAAVCRTGAK